jgi:hypothetical protein
LQVGIGHSLMWAESFWLPSEGGVCWSPGWRQAFELEDNNSSNACPLTNAGFTFKLEAKIETTCLNRQLDERNVVSLILVLSLWIPAMENGQRAQPLCLHESTGRTALYSGAVRS